MDGTAVASCRQGFLCSSVILADGPTVLDISAAPTSSGQRERKIMIQFYYHLTPNPAKIALFLEEASLPYTIVPIDITKGEQHSVSFRALNPNGKVPVIVDDDGPRGRAATVFDSTAILLYLGEKTGRFIGSEDVRPELLSWLMFVATGVGPFSGQSVHFEHYAPTRSDYAVNRYRREAERHYHVLDNRLTGRTYIVGDDYSIVDMSAWGWLNRASHVMGDEPNPFGPFPHLRRWFENIEKRPAVARARAVGTRYVFNTELTEDARRALFPSNYAQPANFTSAPSK